MTEFRACTNHGAGPLSLRAATAPTPVHPMTCTQTITGTPLSGVGFSAVGGAHRVPLEVFCAEIRPLGWYRDWDHVLDVMCADRHERRIIDNLADELAANGAFRHRLRVEDGKLSNGFHRFCATVLAAAAEGAEGAVDVWVVDDDHPDPTWADDYPVCALSFRLTAPQLSTDERDDAFFSLSRSVRLDAHTWAEADAVGASCDIYTVEYMGLDTTRARDLNNAVTAVLADAGIDAELVTVNGYRFAELYGDDI